jgi:hypothetical protein
LPLDENEENKSNYCQEETVPCFLNGVKQSKMILNVDF